MAISIAAIVLSGLALVIATSFAFYQPDKMATSYEPQTKDIYLFSKVDENIDEEKFGIPPDQFSLGQIVVKQGDDVRIHFYNLELVETQEHHTFTILDKPYQMNHDINAGESTLIEFSATTPGVYDYLCTFHEPTMTGQLVVLG